LRRGAARSNEHYLRSLGQCGRRVSAELFEFGDAVERAAAVNNSGLGVEGARRFKIEDAERGQIFLDETVDVLFVQAFRELG